MTVLPSQEWRPSSVSLEQAGFEIALSLQNVMESGFSAMVCSAAEACGGAVIFDMPVAMELPYQRIAAVAAGSGKDERVLLVLLGEDGTTVKVEDCAKSASPFAGLAMAQATLAHCFAGAKPVEV